METKVTPLKTVKEGLAEVLFPQHVFYNPVQEFNRDLTIAVISEFAKEKLAADINKNVNKNETTEVDGNSDSNKTDMNDFVLEAGKKCQNGIKILEGLSASGLRSVRFGLEIPGVQFIVANDFDRAAVDVIDTNIIKNNLKELITSSCDDASMLMYKHKKDRFDVIDLDPYGSASQFLDAAVQAVSDGGLMCVTCTDAAVLCGNGSETCYSKYGAMSLKTKNCHEMGIRIILQCIESHANRYSRYIVPIISLSIDFYFRLFVKVYTGQGKVKRSASKMAMVYNCIGCGSFSLQKIGEAIPTKGSNFKYSPATGPPVSDKCQHCGSRHQMGGPIWADPICDVDFIDRVIKSVSLNEAKLKTSERIVGMLTMLKEELQDIPLYFVTDAICGIVHCQPMSLIQIRSAILNGGYRVSLSHAAQNSIKTDAPHDFVWDIIRTWVKSHPIKASRLMESSIIRTLLEKECTYQVSFEPHPEANPKSRTEKLLRFQENPEKHWGPKSRATRNKIQETPEEKSKRLQGKKTKLDTLQDKGEKITNLE